MLRRVGTPSGHPIVMRLFILRRVLSATFVSRMFRNVGIRRVYPQGGESVETSAQSGVRPPTVHVPEMENMLRTVPRINTGGERQV